MKAKGERQRKILKILAVVIALAMLFCVASMALKSCHKCCEKRCPVCEVLEASETIVKGMGAACEAFPLLFAGLFIVLNGLKAVTPAIFKNSLYFLKVRLNI